MQFFCTKNHYEKWLQENPDQAKLMHLLDIEKAVAAAKEIFEIPQSPSIPE